MKAPFPLVCALALVALTALGSTTAQAQTAFYTANTTTATPEPGAVHFLQVFNLAQGPGVYTINAVTVGINFTGTDAQNIIFNFYSGVDNSSTTTNALANATFLYNLIGNDTPPATGNYSFTYNLTTPIVLTLASSATIGLEMQLLTTSSGAYSTEQNGRFTASAPTVGTSSGLVFNDANLDNTFTGSEQTTFGMANANIRLALAGTYAAVPEPSSWALLGLGAVAAMVRFAWRRRAVRA